VASKVFFTIEQGVNNNRVIHRARTTMGDPVDMSLFTGTLTIKKNYAANSSDPKTFSTAALFSNTGEVRVVISKEMAALIPTGRYVYDIIASNDLGNTYVRICEGYVSVDPAVGAA
jgi:hypothetical protein